MEKKPKTSSSKWVDPDDAPAWTEDQLDRAEYAIGGKIIRPARGTLTRPRGRPKAEITKVPISLRLSPDVLEGLRETGPGWQTKADEVLRSWLKVKGKLKKKPAAKRKSVA